MKKTIFLLGILLFVPFVFAGNENGKITAGKDLLITDMDISVDAKLSRNLEYGDEITKSAYPNSNIKITAKIANNNSGLVMEDVSVTASIDDLNIEKTSTAIDIELSNDKKFELEFVLPSTSEEGDYDILIEADGELNNTLHKVQYLMVLVIDKINQQTTANEQDNNCPNIKVINQSISDLSKEVGSYFSPYAECVSQRDSCKEQIKTKEQVISELQGYQSRYDSCNQNLLVCNNLKETYKFANETCYSSTIPSMQAEKERQNSYWIVFSILAIGGILVYNNREKMKFWQKGEAEKNFDEPE